MKNPWLGLSSYTEESLKEYQFNGRSAAIASLTSLIRRNLFVTLYGRSGIGKTSLLQAGVYPYLRKDGFFPITIRLNDINDSSTANERPNPAAKIIWENVSESLFNKGFTYTPCDNGDVYKPDFSDTLAFRKLFSAGRFLNSDGTEAIPVMVLDQFEEILYKAPASSRLLVSQLYALIDDNYNLEVSHPRWHDDTNFRVVISVREDDLFLFEDVIDSLNCIDFKSNRYRLMPVSDSEAKEIILKPISDKHIFEEGNEESIAKAIIALSKNNGQNVNTLLLSLICYVLYNNSASHNKRITISDLENYTDIIETYYKEATKDLPKEQRYYIEDHLIDNQGRRTSIYLSDLEKHAPEAKRLIGNSNHRLLNENQGRIEFIHDQLASSILKLRNARKSKTSKQLGTFALIILLTCVFLFSFSRVTNIYMVNDTSKYTSNTINNTEITSIVIDSLQSRWTIEDCPSLKSIKIESKDCYVYISNCPSLVDISYPNNYIGRIKVLNCPYINKNGNKIREYVIDDSIAYNKYKSQYPHQSIPQHIHNFYFDYDSISHKIIIKRHPIYTSNCESKYKIPTGLTDSVKMITDCYVPYGSKEYFSRLAEYQPFHSINELPVYYTWQSNAVSMLGFLETEKFWRFLMYIGLLIVQCVFWTAAFSKYKPLYKNESTVIAISFLYGVGMSLLAILSFMSFYWTVFNIILPGNQLISTIIGALGCLLCMLLVYRNAFFSLTRYFKANGIRGFITDIKSSLIGLPKQLTQSYKWLNNETKGFYKKAKDGLAKLPERMKLSYKSLIKNSKEIPNYIRTNAQTIAVYVAVIIVLICYSTGSRTRKKYLENLNDIIECGEYARAYAIFQELSNQHNSFIYPSFTNGLKSIEEKLTGDSIYLAHRITPDYVNEIASKQNSPLDFYNFKELLAVSDDATKFVIKVKYPKSNDLQKDKYQAILLDLNSQAVDVLTPKSDSYYNDFKSSLSPSGNTLVVADNTNDRRYSYSSINKTIMDISNGYYNDIHDIIMESDSAYYYTSYGTLYKALAKPGYSPQKINKSIDLLYNNLKQISDNLIGGTGNWYEIIIYNTLEDSVYFHSSYRHVGDIRAINQDYAVTTKGLFDIKMDSLINENDRLYEYKGQIVELQKHDNKYSFHDLAGNKIVEITSDNNDQLDDIRISKDGNYLITFNNFDISVYSTSLITNRSWTISDNDKELFDLK